MLTASVNSTSVASPVVAAEAIAARPEPLDVVERVRHLLHERLVGGVDGAAGPSGVDLVEHVVDVDAAAPAAAAAEDLEQHDDDDADDAAARGEAATPHGSTILEVVAESAARVPELDHGDGMPEVALGYSARRASTDRCRAATTPAGRASAAPARPATSATISSSTGEVVADPRTPICSATSCQATRPAAIPSGMPNTKPMATSVHDWVVIAREDISPDEPERPDDPEVVTPAANAGGECMPHGRQGEEAEEQPEDSRQELHPTQVGNVRRR